MRLHLRTLLSFTIAGVLVWSAQAQAKRPAKVVKAKLIETVKPARGFVDDPFRFDGAGGRMVYINADAANLAEIRVIDLTQGGAQLANIDISKFTTTPVSVDFVLDGDHFFVVSRPDKDQPAIAALINKRGKVLRKFGPADDIVLTEDNGAQIVVAYSAKADKPATGSPTVTHTVSAWSLEKGATMVKERSLVADPAGLVASMDFRISYWAKDYLRVVGVEGGSWDAKEDQRSPNREAWFDFRTGTISKRIEIANLIEHTQRRTLLGEHNNEAEFLISANDLSGVRIEGEKISKAIKLAEPFHHYLHTSLTYQRSAEGGFFFTLKIDPVNADAVARKRAVPEYLDLYELAAGSTKAVRRARILLKGNRNYRWRASVDHWVLVPLHIGFDRGGKELQIYALD